MIMKCLSIMATDNSLGSEQKPDAFVPRSRSALRLVATGIERGLNLYPESVEACDFNSELHDLFANLRVPMIGEKLLDCCAQAVVWD